MPKLVERARQLLRVRHYSHRTEKAYVHWIKRYILYHGLRHTQDMGAPEVTSFLSHLATERGVSSSTQNQALSAILFLYKVVLEQELPRLEGVERARKPARVPAVFTPGEVRAILSRLSGARWLMGSLLYGAGLRLSEYLRLRVKDIDFSYRQLVVRNGKGGKDRYTVLPESLAEPLGRHLAWVRRLHERDLAAGHGCVELPHALARKYPRAYREWCQEPVGMRHVSPVLQVVTVVGNVVATCTHRVSWSGGAREETPYLRARDTP